MHVALFAATFLTTTMASAWHQGVNLLSEPAAIVLGLPYSIAVMTILLCHEFGHYFLAQGHRVDASLPFFIPAPPTVFFIGTVGAFIRMRSFPPHRRALFDIGAAGPWAGFVVAVPVMILGLQLSEVRPLDPTQGGLMLGDSVLFSALAQLVLGVDAEAVTIVLHPVALAGWVGFLVTALNLMPVGQLDGGHVVYALLGERWHRWISRGTLTALVVLGVGSWPGWLVWVALLVLLGMRHPRTLDTATPLDRRRVVAAVLTVVVFVLIFMPEPIYFQPPAIVIPRGELIPV